MVLLLAWNVAWACGGLVTLDHTEQLAQSDALQAILDVGADAVTVEYRVHYGGNANEFAWIIPVPGQVTDVQEGDDARFETLATLTAPQVNVYEDPESSSSSPGCACGGYATKDGDLAGGRNLSDTGAGGADLGVAVVGQGYAGDYSYTVLDATDSGALTTWLTDRGYDLTYAAAPIDQYVQDPLGYQWIAVQLVPTLSDTPDEGVTISPLRITYGRATGDDKLHALYPSRMGSTIQLPEVRTELYVIDDGHAVAGNGWDTNVDMHVEDDNDADPEEVYADFLRDVGSDRRGLVEVWKGDWTDDTGAARYLTRFDSIVAPATNTTDVSFTTDDDTTAEQRFYVDLGGYYYGGVFPFAALTGLAMAWRKRRK
jgi:hypothetical protein